MQKSDHKSPKKSKKYQPPAIDSRIWTNLAIKIFILTIIRWPYMHISWSKRVYKKFPSIGSETGFTPLPPVISRKFLIKYYEYSLDYLIIITNQFMINTHT